MEKIPDGVAVFLGAVDAGRTTTSSARATTSCTSPGSRFPTPSLIIDGTRKESVLFFTMDEKTADGEGFPSS